MLVGILKLLPVRFKKEFCKAIIMQVTGTFLLGLMAMLGSGTLTAFGMQVNPSPHVYTVAGGVFSSHAWVGVASFGLLSWCASLQVIPCVLSISGQSWRRYLFTFVAGLVTGVIATGIALPAVVVTWLVAGSPLAMTVPSLVNAIVVVSGTSMAVPAGIGFLHAYLPLKPGEILARDGATIAGLVLLGAGLVLGIAPVHQQGLFSAIMLAGITILACGSLDRTWRLASTIILGSRRHGGRATFQARMRARNASIIMMIVLTSTCGGVTSTIMLVPVGSRERLVDGFLVKAGADVRLGIPGGTMAYDHGSQAVFAAVANVSSACLVRETTKPVSFTWCTIDRSWERDGRLVTMHVIDPASYAITCEKFGCSMDVPPGSDPVQVIRDLSDGQGIIIQKSLEGLLQKPLGSAVTITMDGLQDTFTVRGYCSLLPGIPETAMDDPVLHAVISWQGLDAMISTAFGGADIVLKNRFWQDNDTYVNDGCHAHFDRLGFPMSRAVIGDVMAELADRGYPTSHAPVLTDLLPVTISFTSTHGFEFHASEFYQATLEDFERKEYTTSGLVHAIPTGGSFSLGTPPVTDVLNVQGIQAGSVAQVLSSAMAANTGTPYNMIVAPEVLVTKNGDHLTGTATTVYRFEPGETITLGWNHTATTFLIVGTHGGQLNRHAYETQVASCPSMPAVMAPAIPGSISRHDATCLDSFYDRYPCDPNAFYVPERQYSDALATMLHDVTAYPSTLLSSGWVHDNVTFFEAVAPYASIPSAACTAVLVDVPEGKSVQDTKVALDSILASWPGMENVTTSTPVLDFKAGASCFKGNLLLVVDGDGAEDPAFMDALHDLHDEHGLPWVDEEVIMTRVLLEQSGAVSFLAALTSVAWNIVPVVFTSAAIATGTMHCLSRRRGIHGKASRTRRRRPAARPEIACHVLGPVMAMATGMALFFLVPVLICTGVPFTPAFPFSAGTMAWLSWFLLAIPASAAILPSLWRVLRVKRARPARVAVARHVQGTVETGPGGTDREEKPAPRASMPPVVELAPDAGTVPPVPAPVPALVPAKTKGKTKTKTKTTVKVKAKIPSQSQSQSPFQSRNKAIEAWLDEREATGDPCFALAEIQSHFHAKKRLKRIITDRLRYHAKHGRLLIEGGTITFTAIPAPGHVKPVNGTPATQPEVVPPENLHPGDLGGNKDRDGHIKAKDQDKDGAKDRARTRPKATSLHAAILEFMEAKAHDRVFTFPLAEMQEHFGAKRGLRRMIEARVKTLAKNGYLVLSEGMITIATTDQGKNRPGRTDRPDLPVGRQSMHRADPGPVPRSKGKDRQEREEQGNRGAPWPGKVAAFLATMRENGITGIKVSVLVDALEAGRKGRNAIVTYLKKEASAGTVSIEDGVVRLNDPAGDPAPAAGGKTSEEPKTRRKGKNRRNRRKGRNRKKDRRGKKDE